MWSKPIYERNRGEVNCQKIKLLHGFSAFSHSDGPELRTRSQTKCPTNWATPRKGITAQSCRHNCAVFIPSAGDGNRTRVLGLGSRFSTIEIHPHGKCQYIIRHRICQALFRLTVEKRSGLRYTYIGIAMLNFRKFRILTYPFEYSGTI